MVQKKYGPGLPAEEREQLRKLVKAGRSSARVITRAELLLKTGEGWTAPQVAAALDVSERTVFRTKRRYAEESGGSGKGRRRVDDQVLRRDRRFSGIPEAPVRVVGSAQYLFPRRSTERRRLSGQRPPKRGSAETPGSLGIS